MAVAEGAHRLAGPTENSEYGANTAGSPDAHRERMLAFLDGLGAIAEGNAVLLSAHDAACAADKYDDPRYGDLIRHLTAPDDPRRFTRSVQQMAATLFEQD